MTFVSNNVDFLSGKDPVPAGADAVPSGSVRPPHIRLGASHSQTESSEAGPMEILLVEDGLTDARMTIFAIRNSRIHHRLTLVRSIADASAFIGRQGVFKRAPRVSLLLLDVNLPDGSGLHWYAELASKNLTPDATVVLTASDAIEVRDQANELGVYDFLQKPVREEDFLRIVRNHHRLIVTIDPASRTTTRQKR